MIFAKTAILMALLHSPGYGRELMDRIADLTGGLVTLNQGSIYPALAQLKKYRLIESFEGERGEGGRARIYYRLTQRGERTARSQRDGLIRLFT